MLEQGASTGHDRGRAWRAAVVLDKSFIILLLRLTGKPLLLVGGILLPKGFDRIVVARGWWAALPWQTPNPAGYQ